MTAAESPSTTSDTLQAFSISHTCLPRTRSRLGCQGKPLDRSHRSEELSIAAGQGGKGGGGDGPEAAVAVDGSRRGCWLWCDELNPLEGQAPDLVRPIAYTGAETVKRKNKKIRRRR